MSRDGSNRRASRGGFNHNVLAVAGWVKMFGAAAADGAAIADPYAIADFRTTVGKECHTTGGRALVNRVGSGILEILPLLSASLATIKFQLWAFDYIDFELPGNKTRIQVAPEASTAQKGGYATGVPYPLVMDEDPAATQFGDSPSIPSSALHTTTLAYANVADPYYDSAATPFYFCPILRIPIVSAYSVVPWVTSISTGTGILLGRFV